MTYIVLDTWADQPAPVTLAYLRELAADLNALKAELEGVQLEAATLSAAPAERAGATLNGGLVDLGPAYVDGEVVVFRNGLLVREGADWQVADADAGWINVSAPLGSSEQLTALDWS